MLGTRADGVGAARGAAHRLRRPEVRRRVLALADQGVSSLSNVLVAVLVARAFDDSVHFGAFSLAMVAYQLLLGCLRAVTGEPLLSLYAHEGPEVRRRVVADLQAATLLLGLVCSLGLVVTSAALGGLSGSALLALAAVLPLLLVQDTWRFLFIIDRPGAALVIDTVWLAAVVVAMALAPAGASVAWYVVAWGLAGALGALVGTALGRWWPVRPGAADASVSAGGAERAGRSAWPHPWRWLVEHRGMGLRYLGDFLTARSSSEIVLVALGALAGLGALGVVKASFVYFGLLNTLHTGLYLVVVPEGARIRHEPARLRRLMWLATGSQVALAAVWTLAGLALPDRWGREVLGATWDQAQEIMLPMGLAMVGGGLMSLGFLGLRSLGDSRRSLAARLHSTVWHTLCPLVGALVDGALGFAVGFAVARAVSSVIWWRSFDQGVDDLDASPDAAGLAGPGAGARTPASAPMSGPAGTAQLDPGRVTV